MKRRLAAVHGVAAATLSFDVGIRAGDADLITATTVREVQALAPGMFDEPVASHLRCRAA
jgi:hypothetical protein